MAQDLGRAFGAARERPVEDEVQRERTSGASLTDWVSDRLN